MHAYLGVTCHLHFWLNDRGLLRATTVTRGETDTDQESAQKLTPDIPPGIRTHKLPIKGPALYEQAIPAPCLIRLVNRWLTSLTEVRHSCTAVRSGTLLLYSAGQALCCTALRSGTLLSCSCEVRHSCTAARSGTLVRPSGQALLHSRQVRHSCTALGERVTSERTCQRP